MTLGKKKKLVALLVLTGMAAFLIFVFLYLRHRQNKSHRVNVCLIVVEALRADHLGCYGYWRNTSPNIDRLAKEGALFKLAFSQGCETIVSVPSILTSLYPSVHRVFKQGAPLAGEFITLPEILAKNDYLTAAFVAPHLDAIGNLGRRFGAYQSLKPLLYKKLKEQKKSGSAPPRLLTEAIETASKFTPQIVENAVSWLKKNKDRPFFIYIHFLDVHSPYESSGYYRDLFREDEIGPGLQDFVITRIRDRAKGNFLSGLTPTQTQRCLDYIISKYDSGLHFVDEYIGMLLDEMEKLDLSDNTLVILTSDHGEEFLDHGRFFHGLSLYDEVLRVPLIMRLAGVIPKDTVISQIVRLIDIMPTVLEVSGAEAEDSAMQGVSLMPLIDKTRSLEIESFAETKFRSQKSVRTQEWKFIRSDEPEKDGSRPVLYDLTNDQKETRDVAEANPEQRAYFDRRLKAYEADCKKTRASLLGKGGLEQAVVLDETTREILKSLGYAQ